MATKVLLKKSSVADKVPVTDDLEYGELALNYADGKLFFKDSTNTIRSFTTSSGTVQISNGGTGATTRADAINNLLPTQSAAAGFYLTTDGTDVSWAEIAGGSSSSVTYDSFTGDGSETVFELSVTPPSENAVFVSINGVLQDPSTYSVTGTSLSFSTAPESGDNIDTRTISSSGGGGGDSPTIADFEDLTTTDVDQTVDSFLKSEYRSSKYLIQAISGSDVHCTEVLLTHNDTDVFITEYATMFSALSLITVTATIDSTTVYLKVTPANNDTKVDFARTALSSRSSVVPPSGLEGDLMLQSGTEDLMTGTGTVDLDV